LLGCLQKKHIRAISLSLSCKSCV